MGTTPASAGPSGDGGWMPPQLHAVRENARRRAIIAEARGVLADRLACPVGEALQHLIWLARDMGVDMAEAAERVVEGSLAPERRQAPEETVSIFPRGPASRTLESERALRPLDAEALADDATRLEEMPDDPAARAVLDSAPEYASHLIPVHDDSGRIIDFLRVAVNDAPYDQFGRSRTDLVGKRLLLTDPGLAGAGGLFEGFVTVMESGVPYKPPPVYLEFQQEGRTRGARLTLRCVRVPTGICLTWRSHALNDRLSRWLERAERTAQIGFFEWDLINDEVTWSDQMFTIFGRSRSEGALTLQQYMEVVEPEDRPVVEDGVRTNFERLEPVELEHRIITPRGERRHLWLFVEPMLDAGGLPTSVNAVVQDISRRRRAEHALAETRRVFLRQQAEMAEEKRIAVILRDAVLPDDRELASVPGLRIAVRSVSAETAARIGGDWYAARTLPCGQALFAIGDAAGHGLPAAAAMAKTRNGLLGLACTGRPPGRLLDWMNQLVGYLEPETMGTALVASFDPTTKVMNWSCAGHPPPVLLRDGRARSLDVDPDPVLGTWPATAYRSVSTRLHQGDVILLYTDGLVERRGADIDERINRLTEVVSGCVPDPEAVLDVVLDGMDPDRTADDLTLLGVLVE